MIIMIEINIEKRLVNKSYASLNLKNVEYPCFVVIIPIIAYIKFIPPNKT